MGKGGERGGEGNVDSQFCTAEWNAGKVCCSVGCDWDTGNLDLGMVSGEPGPWLASGEGWGRAGGNKMSKLCPKSCVGGILRG